jgi:hypothetical protein
VVVRRRVEDAADVLLDIGAGAQIVKQLLVVLFLVGEFPHQAA